MEIQLYCHASVLRDFSGRTQGLVNGVHQGPINGWEVQWSVQYVTHSQHPQSRAVHPVIASAWPDTPARVPEHAARVPRARTRTPRATRSAPHARPIRALDPRQSTQYRRIASVLPDTQGLREGHVGSVQPTSSVGAFRRKATPRNAETTRPPSPAPGLRPTACACQASGARPRASARSVRATISVRATTSCTSAPATARRLCE